MARLTLHTATVFIVIPFVLGSCATILNQPLQNVKIATGPGIRGVMVEQCALADSSATDDGAARSYYVARSRRDLVVHLELDSSQKTILLHAGKSTAWWLNLWYCYGIGMLVDMHTDKRFAYPRNNYFVLKDTTVYRRRFAPVPAGTVRLSLGLPLVTAFNIATPGKQFVNPGLLGLEAGADYFYRDNHYLSFSAGLAGTGTHRGGVYFTRDNYRQSGTVEYAAARDTRVVGSFDLGYGVSFMRLNWTGDHYHGIIDSSLSSRNTGLGLSFSVQYRIGNKFRAAVLYQPMLIDNQRPGLSYQHYISIGLAWKWAVNNGKKK